MSTTQETAPLWDVAAERAVLGGMMLSQRAIAAAAEALAPADYYRPAHEAIHQAILELDARGEAADPITVGAELDRRGDLARVGGPSYLHGLASSVPTAANAEYYAEIVHERARLRRLVQAGTRIAQEGAQEGADPDAIAARAQADIAEALGDSDHPEAGPIADGFEAYVDALEDLQRNGRARGVPTGFADLDRLTGGFHPGQVIIVAGRPGLGKTALATDFARSASIRHGRPSVIFSLEMDRTELTHRLVSAQARIPLHHLRHQGEMTDEDWDRFAKVTPRITAAPLTIDARPNQTVTQIRSECRRLKQRGGLDLVVIDYLQLLQPATRKTENRQVEVSAMSRAIKLMAKELAVPVVLLAQLNRGPEQRHDKLPILADLRESGSLEQDADVVILLNRPDAYERESPRAGEADLIVAKHRNGPQSTITVAFQGHYSRFVDMAAS